MDPTQQQQTRQYINILLRRKKLILGCFLASLILGIFLCVFLPRTYRTEALLVYQRGKINPTSELAPDISAQVQEVLATLRDQVLSRTSLEEIIKQFQLYQETLAKQPMEDVIDRMRTKYIEVTTSPKGDTFTVAFQGGDPRQVMLVTNALASKFVEENLRFREEKATETSAYIQDELAMARKSLEQKEAAMLDYKLKHYNEMPDQRQTNIARLNALQTTYQGIQNSLQELERTKIMVQEQIGLRKEFLTQSFGNEPNTMMQAPNMNTGSSRQSRNTSSLVQNLIPQTAQTHRQLADQLAAAQTELAALEARYTEQHPEVKRLKKTIAQLEEQLKTVKAEQQIDERKQEGDKPTDPQLVQLELQLKDIELSMAQIKKEKEEAKKQIETYQHWIAVAPTREAEWGGLTRDYQQLNEHYQSLVASNLSAASMETLERKQKGSQFKVLDPARLPEKPYSPDFKKILLLSLIAGLGLAGAIAFFLEFTDSSFKEAHDLENYLKLPIVCSIPVIQTEPEKRKIYWGSIIWSLCFFVILLCIIAGSVYLWEKGLLII